MSYIEDLKTVIHHLHGAEATHRESVPVKEVWNGQTIWEGIVEVFTLHDHAEANTAYAWSHETDDPARPQQHVTVLHVPPVVSPITAVRAAIAAEFRTNATA
jgi:hypothetical protein